LATCHALGCTLVYCVIIGRPLAILGNTVTFAHLNCSKQSRLCFSIFFKHGCFNFLHSAFHVFHALKLSRLIKSDKLSFFGCNASGLSFFGCNASSLSFFSCVASGLSFLSCNASGLSSFFGCCFLFKSNALGFSSIKNNLERRRGVPFTDVTGGVAARPVVPLALTVPGDDARFICVPIGFTRCPVGPVHGSLIRPTPAI